MDHSERDLWESPPHCQGAWASHRGTALRDLGGARDEATRASSFSSGPPITEGPMGLECGLGLGARHPKQPGQLGVCPVRQGFLLRTGLPDTRVCGLSQLLGCRTEWRCLQAAILTPGALLPNTGRRGMRTAADRCARSRERGNVAKAHGQWLPG